jgi:L-ascorbate metabolism protein UlaG (beta-lactamase superfamily)
MKTGSELIRDVDDCTLEYGQLALWWLGQHSFILKLGQQIIYIDPFLSDLRERQVPPLLLAQDIRHAALVLGSHDHTDHIDRAVWPALAAHSRQARFIVPDLLRDQLARDLHIPAERFLGLDDGASVEAAGLRVSGVAAAHEFLDRDPASGRYPYLGYVVEGNGCSLYHAGDSCIYEGLQTKLRAWQLDVVLLPINGRDARRLAANCIGNMTYQEAADLAGALQPGLTIPTHYDMFAFNREDPGLFVDYMHVKYPQLEVHVCEYGERHVYQRHILVP